MYRWIPAASILVNYSVLVWRLWAHYRRYRVYPISTKSDTPSSYVDRWLTVVAVAALAEAGAWGMGHPLTAAVVSAAWPWAAWSGMVLALMGWILTLTAQAQLAISWQIGIDYERTTPLVESGVYRYSRNPVFLGMLLSLFGALLMVPTYLMTATFLVGLMLMGIQARLEERFLIERHPERYHLYQSKVRRWL